MKRNNKITDSLCHELDFFLGTQKKLADMSKP